MNLDISCNEAGDQNRINSNPQKGNTVKEERYPKINFIVCYNKKKRSTPFY